MPRENGLCNEMRSLGLSRGECVAAGPDPGSPVSLLADATASNRTRSTLHCKVMQALHEHAEENLRYIRSAMERAGTFTAIPGYGSIAVGITAVVASLLAGGNFAQPRWLAVWLCEAALAAGIAALSIVLKARASSTSLASAPTRRFALAFLPAVAAGAVLTYVFWTHALRGQIAPMWLLLYGTAVTAGGALSVRIVPIMGLVFAVLGTAGFFLPESSVPHLLTIGFGLLHVGFGALIARYYGG